MEQKTRRSGQNTSNNPEKQAFMGGR